MSAPHPFSFPAYRAYWISRFASMLSQYGMMLIVGWQAYNLARESMGIGPSAGILGLLGLLQFIPLFVLTPLVGWVADRWDRRWIIRIFAIVQTGVAALLCWLTWTDAISLFAIYGVSVVLGICRAFLGPALSALAPNLVPRESLPRAIALSTIAWQVGVIAGPGFAGPLYDIANWIPYLICTGLFAISAVSVFTIGPVTRTSIDRTRGPWQQVADGMAYVWSNKLVLGAISLDLFVMMLAGATAMIPVFARDILHSGETGLSLLAASPAIGAALVAIIFSFFPLSKNVGGRMMIAMVVFGAATIGFAFSTWLPLSMLCLAICGAADMFSVFVRQSLIQLNTPDEKRGRVGAVSQMTISASNELGDAVTGGVAVIIGPVFAIAVGGIGAIAVTGIWARLFPELKNARTFEPQEQEEQSLPSR